MIDAEVVGAVLAKCSAYDARNTPSPSDIVIDAWLEHFRLFPNVTPQDLLGDGSRGMPGAVTEYYRSKHNDQLTPVDLSDIARRYARERFERSDIETEDHPASPERQGFEARCDAKAAADPPELESKAVVRQQAVESYARRFGISPAEAAGRMNPRRSTANALDSRAVDVAHRRMSAPPAPVPCPDCGALGPCPCEEVAPDAL